jgi:hypothetical protein
MQKRANLLLDSLNKLRSHNFLLSLEIWGTIPEARLPIRDIRRRLECWLVSLDPDSVMANITLNDGMPTGKERYVYPGEGWRLEFSAVPLRKEKRGLVDRDMRMIGSFMHIGASSFVDARQPLLRTLGKKGDHYGELDLPYIVAVNILNELTEDNDICAALFGREAVSRIPESGQWTLIRQRDGFWMHTFGPRNTRVSAILVTPLLEPFRVAMTQPVLWHNPWAKKPLDPALWQGPQRILHVDDDLSRGDLEARDGTPACELLGLDPDWPHIAGIGGRRR